MKYRLLHEKEISDIAKLREQGYSYIAIGRVMHINKETVKKYCHDYGIVCHGEMKSRSENQALRCCKFCGSAINDSVSGSTKEFCSNTCRKKHWENNKNNLLSNHEFVLPVYTPKDKKGLDVCQRKSDELVQGGNQNER